MTSEHEEQPYGDHFILPFLLHKFKFGFWIWKWVFCTLSFIVYFFTLRNIGSIGRRMTTTLTNWMSVTSTNFHMISWSCAWGTSVTVNTSVVNQSWFLFIFLPIPLCQTEMGTRGDDEDGDCFFDAPDKHVSLDFGFLFLDIVFHYALSFSNIWPLVSIRLQHTTLEINPPLSESPCSTSSSLLEVINSSFSC